MIDSSVFFTMKWTENYLAQMAYNDEMYITFRGKYFYLIVDY